MGQRWLGKEYRRYATVGRLGFRTSAPGTPKRTEIAIIGSEAIAPMPTRVFPPPAFLCSPMKCKMTVWPICAYSPMSSIKRYSAAMVLTELLQKGCEPPPSLHPFHGAGICRRRIAFTCRRPSIRPQNRRQCRILAEGQGSSRLTQRNPTWLVDVSTGSACRAAGR